MLRGRMPRLLSWHGDEGGAEVDGFERLVCKLMKFFIREFSGGKGQPCGRRADTTDGFELQRSFGIEGEPRDVARR